MFYPCTDQSSKDCWSWHPTANWGSSKRKNANACGHCRYVLLDARRNVNTGELACLDPQSGDHIPAQGWSRARDPGGTLSVYPFPPASYTASDDKLERLEAQRGYMLKIRSCPEYMENELEKKRGDYKARRQKMMDVVSAVTEGLKSGAHQGWYTEYCFFSLCVFFSL